MYTLKELLNFTYDDIYHEYVSRHPKCTIDDCIHLFSMVYPKQTFYK